MADDSILDAAFEEVAPAPKVEEKVIDDTDDLVNDLLDEVPDVVEPTPTPVPTPAPAAAAPAATPAPAAPAAQPVTVRTLPTASDVHKEQSQKVKKDSAGYFGMG